ncbi:class F sortase [Streptomyces sp. cmx-4-25]|uniref:class F sortase n=1 Tax=Streptomyces sp. cmx-4-25 TaxID=2790933 RepID=UPI00397F333F
MAPRRSRITRRRRRLFRLARTVTAVVVLVVGGFWWAGGEEPSAPPLASAPAASDEAASGEAASGEAGGAGAEGVPREGTGAAAGAPAALDHEAKPEAPPEGVPPSKSVPSPKATPSPKAVPRSKGTSGQAAAPLPRSRPTTVAVPAITIEAPVTDLGLDAAGRLAAPPVDNPRVVGWYAKGPTPGERGTAVVVGHRDTRTGPAVFLNLGVLNPGNTVRIARADGKVAVFTVDRVKTYAKDDFPDKEVYGATGRPELRLLTCGGSFDRKTGYDANIVVFAHLTDTAQKI